MSVQIQHLNKVQKSAYRLIQSDARFVYTLVDISKNAKNIDNNYTLMSSPVVGLFAEGASQWCLKVGLCAPTLNKEEKKYYQELRQGIKILEKSPIELSNEMWEKYGKSDAYFSSLAVRANRASYLNIGVDIYCDAYCGNTILCSIFNPVVDLGNRECGQMIREMAIIAGRIASFFKCTDFPPYRYRDDLATYKDYNLAEDSFLADKTENGLMLFSILCYINYATVFIELYFEEDIPQKFKISYLLYYYLCSFISDLNEHLNRNYYLDTKLVNRDLRNCLAHYGLGVLMKEKDIDLSDPLFGVTRKALGMDYKEAKKFVFNNLNNLAEQIKRDILK